MPDALPMRLFISLSNDAFDATFEPRYTKLSTFSVSLQLILIDGKTFVPRLRILVFLRLIVRPKSEFAEENRLKESFIVAHLDLKKYFYLNSFFILKYFNRFHLADFLLLRIAKKTYDVRLFQFTVFLLIIC